MGDCAARMRFTDFDAHPYGEVGRCYGMMEGFGDLGDLRIDGQRAKADDKGLERGRKKRLILARSYIPAFCQT